MRQAEFDVAKPLFPGYSEFKTVTDLHGDLQGWDILHIAHSQKAIPVIVPAGVANPNHHEGSYQDNTPYVINADTTAFINCVVFVLGKRTDDVVHQLKEELTKAKTACKEAEETAKEARDSEAKLKTELEKTTGHRDMYCERMHEARKTTEELREVNAKLEKDMAKVTDEYGQRTIKELLSEG